MQMIEEIFLQVLDELREENLEHPIMVEGSNDLKSLRNLGFTGEIILLNTGKTMDAMSGQISLKYREVILLMDWDRKGRFLMNKLKSLLESMDVKVNTSFWKKLGKFSKDLFYVESLDTYVKKLMDERPL